MFFRLRYNRWWRVLLHLCLLSFLCAAGICWGMSRHYRSFFEEQEKRFGAEFGGVVWSAKGIVPLAEPEKARSFALPMGGVIDYRPENVSGSGITEKEAQTLNFLFFWRPRLLVSAVRSEVSWVVWMQSPESEGGELKSVTTAELPAFLAELPQDEDEEWELLVPEDRILTPPEVMNILKSHVTASLMLMMFGMTFGMTILYTVIFAGMFRLTGGVRRLRNLSGSEFWKIGIYAAFPVMPVASCFPALALPYLSYGTVFMIGLVFYWLTVVGRIERENGKDVSQDEKK